jgi:ParB family chromosome partitioning protein
MSSKSKRLGSLADIFQSENLDGTVRKIKLAKIVPSEKQPRQDRKKSVEELAKSIQSEGLLQPIVVSKIENRDSYKIIAGERRFHAVTILAWEEIECKILNKNDKDIFRIAVIENLQRENLSPFEEAESLSILKNDYNYTDSEIASIFGKSRNYISEIISISQLSKEQLKACKEAGIENKNLLVQAVQSSKKGEFGKFIDKIKLGELKTVKQAKEFNKKKQTLLTPTKIFNLQRTKNQIIIKSRDEKILDKIESILNDLNQ